LEREAVRVYIFSEPGVREKRRGGGGAAGSTPENVRRIHERV